MKIACDVCSGPLTVTVKGRVATCNTCGLEYSLAYLREKYWCNAAKVPVITPPKPEDISEKSLPVFVDTSQMPPLPPPKQFVMRIFETHHDCLMGRVEQGGIGVGEKVYINGDYGHPYTIYSLESAQSIKEGMCANIYLEKCSAKVIRGASVVTGCITPVINAYQYNGTTGAYFLHLLAQYFRDYNIATDSICNQTKQPVDFLLYQSGKPKIAIFLLHSSNSKGRNRVERAKTQLAPDGIACVHFYENYRNDAPYVVERIRQALAEVCR